MDAVIVCFPSCSHSLSLSWQRCCSQRHVYRPDFQALQKVPLAEELCSAAKRPEMDGQLWNAASHHTEDPGGRRGETPQKQLEVRWLFHVFISQRWSINLDWHSLEYILCVLICVCLCMFLLKRKKDKAKEPSVSFLGVCFIWTGSAGYNILYHFQSLSNITLLACSLPERTVSFNQISGLYWQCLLTPLFFLVVVTRSLPSEDSAVHVLSWDCVSVTTRHRYRMLTLK